MPPGRQTRWGRPRRARAQRETGGRQSPCLRPSAHARPMRCPPLCTPGLCGCPWRGDARARVALTPRPAHCPPAMASPIRRARCWAPCPPRHPSFARSLLWTALKMEAGRTLLWCTGVPLPWTPLLCPVLAFVAFLRLVCHCPTGLSGVACFAARAGGRCSSRQRQRPNATSGSVCRRQQLPAISFQSTRACPCCHLSSSFFASFGFFPLNSCFASACTTRTIAAGRRGLGSTEFGFAAER